VVEVVFRSSGLVASATLVVNEIPWSSVLSASILRLLLLESGE
jgi:hypothetical protein